MLAEPEVGAEVALELELLCEGGGVAMLAE